MRALRYWGLGVLAALMLSTPAVALGKRDAPRSFYGVVSQLPSFSERDVGKMRRGGVGSVRFVIPWDRVERTEGDYDWALTDAKLEAISDSGARAVPFVFGVPAWAGAPRTPPLGSPGLEADWQRFLLALVERYGPGGELAELDPEYEPVRSWQVWNEPNLPAFWGFSTPRVGDYVELLRLSAVALRAADPGAEVILAGLSPAAKRLPPAKYLRRIYRTYRELDAEPDFDRIAVHPYGARLRDTRRRVRRVVRVAQRASGSRQPLLIGEVGWASRESGRHDFGGDSDYQADRLRRAFAMFERRRRSWRIGSVHWYAWQDEGRERRTCPFCASAGLFRADGRPKPAWRAFRRVAGRR